MFRMVDLDVPEVHGTAPGDGRTATGRWGRFGRRLGRTALSPCPWLLAGALVVYGLFTQDLWDQLQVGACDLGIFYQAVHGWAFHGWPYVPIKGYPQLGDHFSPIFLLLAPLFWVDDSPDALMWAQVVLVCLSSVPVYVAVRRAHGLVPATLIQAAYLASFAVQGTLAFPVHEVMFGAPLIAWGLERAMAGRWTWASLVMATTVFVKEDMGLTVAAFGLYALVNRKWRHALGLIGFGLAMFALCVLVIIPSVSGGGFTYSGDYSANLGGAQGVGPEIWYLLTHPFQVAGTLWDNPVKRADWVHLLLPVGFLALASPMAIVGLPIMLTRMLSTRDTQWSWELYYDLPLLPIVYLAAVDAYGRFWRLRPLVRLRGRAGWPKPVLASLLAGAGVYAVWTVQPLLQVNGWIFLNRYRADPGYVQQVDAVLPYLPPGVPTQATNVLTVPPIARNTTTVFDNGVAAGDWALIDLHDPGQCGPSTVQTQARAAQLLVDGWVLVARDGRIELLHKP